MRLQIRPLIFSTYCLTIFISYWIYINVLTPDTKYAWLDKWMTCIALGGGQDYCANTISVSQIPSVSGFAAIYVSISRGFFALLSDF